MSGVRASFAVAGAALAVLAVESPARPAASEACRPRMPTRREVFERQWWRAVRPRLEDCDRLAVGKGVFGDAIVEFWPSESRPVRVGLSAELHGDIERCVNRVLRQFARELRPHLGEVDETHGIVALGHPAPFLPAARVLVPAWIEATGRDPARRRTARVKLRRLLPADVTVAADGCLEVRPTPVFSDAVRLWFERETRPVDTFWLPGGRFESFGPDVNGAKALAMDPSKVVLQTLYLRTDIRTETRAWGTSDQRRTVAVAHRLCLRQLDPATVDRIRDPSNQSTCGGDGGK